MEFYKQWTDGNRGDSYSFLTEQKWQNPTGIQQIPLPLHSTIVHLEEM